MKDPITLLDRAKADLVSVDILLKNSTDDVVLDIAAYQARKGRKITPTS